MFGKSRLEKEDEVRRYLEKDSLARRISREQDICGNHMMDFPQGGNLVLPLLGEFQKKCTKIKRAFSSTGYQAVVRVFEHRGMFPDRRVAQSKDSPVDRNQNQIILDVYGNMFARVISDNRIEHMASYATMCPESTYDTRMAKPFLVAYLLNPLEEDSRFVYSYGEELKFKSTFDDNPTNPSKMTELCEVVLLTYSAPTARPTDFYKDIIRPTLLEIGYTEGVIGGKQNARR